MSVDDERGLPDQSTRCLTCACANADNAAAGRLLREAEALTATGVIAAIFLAQSGSRWQLTEHARQAIAEQRAWCASHGAWDAHACPFEWIRKVPSQGNARAERAAVVSTL